MRANYQKVLKHLYSEVAEQKEKLFLSLGKTTTGNLNEEHEESIVRARRGLINFMGSGMHYFFGVCDDDCTVKTNDAIELTEKNGKNVLHLMKQQTTIVKTAMKQLTTTLNQTQAIYQDIQEHEKSFIHDLKLLGNATEKILALLNSNSLQNMYTLLTNQFAYETTTLNQIVTAAKAGVIHSSLLSITDIANIVKDIKTRINHKRLDIPMGTRPFEVYELLKIVKMSIFYGNERIVFITKIPLATTEETTMYNIIPIPIRVSNTRSDLIQVLDPETPFMAITKDRSHYTPITGD